MGSQVDRQWFQSFNTMLKLSLKYVLIIKTKNIAIFIIYNDNE